ncbi:MAG: methyltransferase domain-containing protein [Isosphaeraceae bacterium]
MASEARLVSDRFPRSNAYHPDWVLKNGTSGTGSTLWITEWLAEEMALRPGMRVLDLGCGRAISSIFLAREFGVQVWATDLWFAASDNLARIRDSGLEDRVFPLHADARALPFAGEFFDAIACVDAYPYFGTDDLYLNYLAHFVKSGGRLGIAGAGLTREIDGDVPEHMRDTWSQDFWALHSAAWWRRLWERTGIVEVDVADDMPDAWRSWLDWQNVVSPDNTSEIELLKADRGRYMTWIRMVGRRRAEAKLVDYCWPDTMKSLPSDYEPRPMLRS